MTGFYQAAPICYFHSQIPNTYCVVMPCPLQTSAAEYGPNLNSIYQGWRNHSSSHRLFFYFGSNTKYVLRVSSRWLPLVYILYPVRDHVDSVYSPLPTTIWFPYVRVSL